MELNGSYHVERIGPDPVKPATPTRARSPLRFRLFRDIDPTPRKHFLVGKFLGAGEMSCIFGQPGSAKSLFATDMASHIAAGREWFGRRVQSGAVLYVAAERAALLERRLAAFRKHHGVDDLPLAVVAGSVDLRTPKGSIDHLTADARYLADLTGQPVRLIVIDTVSRVLNGGDENSPKDMGALVAVLSELQQRTGAHICGLHHVPQDGNNRLRGHGSLLGALDTTIAVEKTGAIRTATVIKDNDGAEGERLAFDIRGVHLATDTETGEETWAPVAISVEGFSGPAHADRAQPTKVGKIALAALQEAIGEHGAIPPAAPQMPVGIKAVTLHQWRSFAYQRGISGSDEARARQKAFERAHENLVALKLVAEWDPYVWPL